MRRSCNSCMPLLRRGGPGSSPGRRSTTPTASPLHEPARRVGCAVFHGSIPTDMCRIVREHVSLWSDVTDVYNACCGNFTVERTIASLGKRMHSCDVLLYSTAIGRYYTGEPE